MLTGPVAVGGRHDHAPVGCEYVGRTPLAKHYGTLAMDVLRRRAALRGA